MGLRPLGDLVSIQQGLATFGRGAGARAGDWAVGIVSVNDIVDERLELAGAEPVEIERNVKTEKHLLHPYDLLVAARANDPKVALVPPAVSRTVAGATLLVVRAFDTDAGMGHYLWWYLTSKQGRAELKSRMRVSTTVSSLSVQDLAGMEIPVPTGPQLHRTAELVEASEAAYASAIEAARLRRTVFRDHIIATLRGNEERVHDTD